MQVYRLLPLTTLHALLMLTSCHQTEKPYDMKQRGRVRTLSDSHTPPSATPLKVSYPNLAKALFQVRQRPVMLSQGQAIGYKFPDAEKAHCCRGSCCPCPLPCIRWLATGSSMSRLLAAMYVFSGLYWLTTIWTPWDPLSLDLLTTDLIEGSICITPTIDNTTQRDTTYVPLSGYADDWYDRGSTYYNATQTLYESLFEIYTGEGDVGEPAYHTWDEPADDIEDQLEVELSTTCKKKKCLTGKKGFLGLGYDCKKIKVPCIDEDAVSILLQNQINSIRLSTYEAPDSNFSLGSNTNFTLGETEIENTLYDIVTTLQKRLATGAAFYPLWKAFMIYGGEGYVVNSLGLKQYGHTLLSTLDKVYFAIGVVLIWYLAEYFYLVQEIAIPNLLNIEGLIPSLCYTASENYVTELEAKAEVCDTLENAQFLFEQGIDSVQYYSAVEGTYQYSENYYGNWSTNLSYYQNLVHNTSTFDCDFASFFEALNDQFAISVKWANLRILYKILLPILTTGTIHYLVRLCAPLATYNGRIVIAKHAALPFKKKAKQLNHAWSLKKAVTTTGTAPKVGCLNKLCSSNNDKEHTVVDEMLYQNADALREHVEDFLWVQSILPGIIYSSLLIYILSDLAAQINRRQ